MCIRDRLDIVMPVMDGYTFLSIMKADPLYSSIPVIVTTQNDGETDEVAAYQTARPILWLSHTGPVSYTHLDVYKRQGRMESYMKELGLVMNISELGVTQNMLEDIADSTFVMQGGYKELNHCLLYTSRCV